ncbi:hypothetical protein LSH36_57g06017 [Paralvinella palmiformis]|uniref:Uncharacterized protein n=1 Tax=Paralvinella palmiformis TaxID=53620 RepID=A0AAD9NE56_9ANNE|nr:hypothetical protein LSH36_57g06017 [Paralvinella palmiformis]
MSALNPFADLSGYAGSAPALNQLWIKVSGIPAPWIPAVRMTLNKAYSLIGASSDKGRNASLPCFRGNAKLEVSYRSDHNLKYCGRMCAKSIQGFRFDIWQGHPILPHTPDKWHQPASDEKFRQNGGLDSDSLKTGMTVYVLHPQSHKWMRGQVVDQENSNVTAQTEEGADVTMPSRLILWQQNHTYQWAKYGKNKFASWYRPLLPACYTKSMRVSELKTPPQWKDGSQQQFVCFVMIGLCYRCIAVDLLVSDGRLGDRYVLGDTFKR